VPRTHLSAVKMPPFKVYWQYADKPTELALEVEAKDIDEAIAYAHKNLKRGFGSAWVVVPGSVQPPIAQEQRKDLLGRMFRGEAYVRGKKRRKFYEERDNKVALEQIEKKL